MTEMSPPDHTQSLRPAAYVLWALCGGWAAVIFSFSARPGSQIPGQFAEIGHFGEYFVFGALLYAALAASGRREVAAAAALIVASLYGMTDEFHQHFVVMRTPDVVDWGVDTVGAACGILLALTTAAIMQRRHTPRTADKRR